jgi:hypothetical protein
MSKSRNVLARVQRLESMQQLAFAASEHCDLAAFYWLDRSRVDNHTPDEEDDAAFKRYLELDKAGLFLIRRSDRIRAALDRFIKKT